MYEYVCHSGGLPGGPIKYMTHREELQRVIVEATNQCNLACKICLRQSWAEIPGHMSEAVFSKFVDDLDELSSPPEVFFGGYGEPLSHPDIVDMIRRTSAIGSRTSLITNGTLLTMKLVETLVESLSFTDIDKASERY